LQIANNASINSIKQHGISSISAVRNTERSGFRQNTVNTDYEDIRLELSGIMRTEYRGRNDIGRRAQESISLAQAADGALEKAQNVLQRLSDLAAMSVDTANQENDRIALDFWFTHYKFELSELGTIEVKGMEFIKTDTSVSFEFQTDTYSDAVTEVTIEPINIDGLGSVETAAAAQDAQANVGSALDDVSSARERLGEVKDQLQNNMLNRSAPGENRRASEGGIRDADTARKMADSLRNSLLSKTMTADYAQANAVPQGVIQLFGIG